MTKATPHQQKILDRLKSGDMFISNCSGLLKWRDQRGRTIKGERAVNIDTFLSMRRNGFVRSAVEEKEVSPGIKVTSRRVILAESAESS